MKELKQDDFHHKTTIGANNYEKNQAFFQQS